MRKRTPKAGDIVRMTERRESTGRNLWTEGNRARLLTSLSLSDSMIWLADFNGLQNLEGSFDSAHSAGGGENGQWWVKVGNDCELEEQVCLE